MGQIVCFGVGLFTPTWTQCLAIAAAVAAFDLLLIWVPKLRNDDIGYVVAYLGTTLVLDVLIAVIGHGVRRLYLRFLKV